ASGGASCQRVIHHGTSRATPPGATTRKIAEPMLAPSFRMNCTQCKVAGADGNGRDDWPPRRSRMKMRLLGLGCVVALVACDHKPDESAAATPGPGGTPAAAGARAAPAAPESGPPLRCAKLVPRALVDKYLGGFELKELKPAAGGILCEWKRGAPAAASVRVTIKCSDALKAAMPSVMKMFKDKPGTATVAEVPGIGQGAITLASGPQTTLQFWDDDTNCMVIVTGFGSDI